jgi:UPF0755 protein
VNKRLRILFILILSVFILFFASLFPLPFEKNRRVDVVILPGESLDEIANELVEKGVVKNGWLFKFWAYFEGVDRRIRAGEYVLQTNMWYTDVLKKLEAKPKKRYFHLVIPEGFNLNQIARKIGEDTPFSPERFLYLANHFEDFDEYWFFEGKRPSSLEGYLFPKTYLLKEGMTEEEIIKLMLEQFRKEISSLNLSKLKGREVTVSEWVIIASLIEKEAKVSEERPLVAAVIYNRLQKDMPLQMCSTVQYVLGWKKKLTKEDLKINSPYNTYLHKGLPPGPICNPGLDSLKAALEPAEVDYLYYVLTDSEKGTHTFTSSYEEFLKAKKKAKQENSN